MFHNPPSELSNSEGPLPSWMVFKFILNSPCLFDPSLLCFMGCANGVSFFQLPPPPPMSPLLIHLVSTMLLVAWFSVTLDPLTCAPLFLCLIWCSSPPSRAMQDVDFLAHREGLGLSSRTPVFPHIHPWGVLFPHLPVPFPFSFGSGLGPLVWNCFWCYFYVLLR